MKDFQNNARNSGGFCLPIIIFLLSLTAAITGCAPDTRLAETQRPPEISISPVNQYVVSLVSFDTKVIQVYQKSKSLYIDAYQYDIKMASRQNGTIKWIPAHIISLERINQDENNTKVNGLESIVVSETKDLGDNPDDSSYYLRYVSGFTNQLGPRFTPPTQEGITTIPLGATPVKNR